MPPIADIELCIRGYHLCRESDLVRWLGPTIWEAEWRGDIIEGDDKVVVSEARLIRECEGWNERTARLFACDCAERVVHLNPDPRVRECIAVARRYADGEATDVELAAARAAAWVARVAAWDAWDAWAAAWVAASDAAWEAASDAAWEARAAASDAAWDAAYKAEGEWQTARLMEIIGASMRGRA